MICRVSNKGQRQKAIPLDFLHERVTKEFHIIASSKDLPSLTRLSIEDESVVSHSIWHTASKHGNLCGAYRANSALEPSAELVVFRNEDPV